MSRCLVDITSFNAIGSIFKGNTIDPAAYILAGKLADVFAYNENIFYVVPQMKEEIPRQEPDILMSLKQRDKNNILSRKLDLPDQINLPMPYLSKTFKDFEIWVNNNIDTAMKWLRLHNERWIKERRPKPYEGLFHNLSQIMVDKKEELEFLEFKFKISIENLIYLYDVILRYPLYGNLTDQDEFYLNHPIRDVMTKSGIVISNESHKQIPVSFSKYIQFLLEKKAVKNMDEYTSMLHILRHQIRDRELHLVNSNSVDKSIIEDIFVSSGLKPRLKIDKTSKILPAMIAGASGITGDPAMLFIGTSVGVGLSVAGIMWSGIVPKSLAKIKWLRWALDWGYPK